MADKRSRIIDFGGIERFLRWAGLIIRDDGGGAETIMKSIITTYPDFQSLPQGVKKMLLASENFFFGEVRLTPLKNQGKPKPNFNLGMLLPSFGGKRE